MKSLKGFTLIELLITIVLGVLITMAVLAALRLGVQQSRGRDAEVLTSLVAAQMVVNDHFNRNGDLETLATPDLVAELVTRGVPATVNGNHWFQVDGVTTGFNAAGNDRGFMYVEGDLSTLWAGPPANHGGVGIEGCLAVGLNRSEIVEGGQAEEFLVTDISGVVRRCRNTSANGLWQACVDYAQNSVNCVNATGLYGS